MSTPMLLARRVAVGGGRSWPRVATAALLATSAFAVGGTQVAGQIQEFGRDPETDPASDDGTGGMLAAWLSRLLTA